jgi:hypothetical protein
MIHMTKAQTPEDITRLFVERVNAGDADGLADPSRWPEVERCSHPTKTEFLT